METFYTITTIPELIDCTEMYIKTTIGEGHCFNAGSTADVVNIHNMTPADSSYKVSLRFNVDFTTGIVKGQQFIKATSAGYSTVKRIYYR